MLGVYVHTKIKKQNLVQINRIAKLSGKAKNEVFNNLIERGLKMKKGTKKAAPKAKPMPKAKPVKKK